MKPNKKLIVFGEDWDRFPSSTQNLISGLLKLGWSVTWINSIGMQKPHFSWFYLKRLIDKLLQFFQHNKSRKQTLSPGHLKGLTVIKPIIFPFIGNSLFDKLNCFLFKKQLTRMTHQDNFANTIIWITLPTAYPLLKLFPSSPKVYYCGDDYARLGTYPNPEIPFFESKLIEETNLIFVVSDTLSQKIPENKKFYLDHGIDVSLFTQAYTRPADLPVGKPIAGFYGLLADWVDLELIYKCATQLNTWNFVLIGPKTVNLGKLLKLDNLFYLGPKRYEDIPAYSQYWDVGLIPFIKDKVSDACNPLKIKEYLLTGKPVVTVDIPALDIYKEYIYMAKDDHDFITGIKRSLHDKNKIARTNLFKNQSWDDKALLVEEQLLHINLSPSKDRK